MTPQSELGKSIDDLCKQYDAARNAVLNHEYHKNPQGAAPDCYLVLVEHYKDKLKAVRDSGFEVEEEKIAIGKKNFKVSQQLTVVDKKPISFSNSSSHYVSLQNICCRDANGNVFENYKEVHVDKNLTKAVAQTFNYHDAVESFDEKTIDGYFLPSFALTCNILEALYKCSIDTEAKNLLEEYWLNEDSDNNMFLQNTIIDWETGSIAHYPKNSFSGNGNSINAERKTSRIGFNPREILKGPIDCSGALDKPSNRRFFRNLTGLYEPNVLLEIADHFGLHFNFTLEHLANEQSQYSTSLGKIDDKPLMIFALGNDLNKISKHVMRGVYATSVEEPWESI